MRSRLVKGLGRLAFAALAAGAGCAASDGAQDAGQRSATLAQVDVAFTRDVSGSRLGMHGWFARTRPAAMSRAATLLGVGHDDEIGLDGCVLVDGAAELDRAFRGEAAADVQLLDAGRVVLRSPSDAIALERRRYPDLTPEVAGVVYGSSEGASLAIEPGGVYSLAGDGGEEIGPFITSAMAPRAFPSLETPAWRRGADLELRWSEAGEVSDPLLLVVSSGGAHALHCRVRDDGAFTVPHALLDELPLVGAPATISATRERAAWFTAPGLGNTPGQLTLGLRDVVPLVDAANNGER